MRTRTTADCGHRELAGTYQEGRWTQERKQLGNIYIFHPGWSKESSITTSLVRTLGPQILPSGGTGPLEPGGMVSGPRDSGA